MLHHDRSIWEADPVIENLNSSRAAYNRILRLGSFLSRLIRGLGSRSILDLGVGDGLLASILLMSLKELHLTGFDFSRPLLEKARKRLEMFGSRVTLREVDLIEGLPRKVHGDLVLFVRTLHHFDSQASSQVLSAVGHRLCQPHHLAIVERWAFEPINRYQTCLLSARKAIATARFPGVGEFHHTESDYIALLMRSGYRIVDTLRHRRSIHPKSYLRKLGGLGLTEDYRMCAEIFRGGPVTLSLPTSIVLASKGA